MEPNDLLKSSAVIALKSSQVNPVHTLPPNILKTHFNIILLPTLVCSQWSAFFRPSNTKFIHLCPISPSPHASSYKNKSCNYPRSSISSDAFSSEISQTFFAPLEEPGSVLSPAVLTEVFSYFFSFFRQIPEYYLKLSHDRFLPYIALNSLCINHNQVCGSHSGHW